MQSVDDVPAGALYGQLAFDHYALQDAQQWEEVVRRLAPVERLPYHSAAMALRPSRETLHFLMPSRPHGSSRRPKPRRSAR
ncbi:hypothetical protein G6O67_006629 [Ophiocordyceps sinensis]|uniref:Uncharacterized protein n=1 Tax=Ophiocordyceps sinensis TaxID=72228 RepID=A0A8H4PMI4_9HYPO|nr:hypothetical protein G6O67_006629 [Ophiocordyceps sinensis]